MRCLTFVPKARARPTAEAGGPDRVADDGPRRLRGQAPASSRLEGQVSPIAPRSARLRSMSRPRRLEFPGAVYHVTSRGDRREAIYRDDGVYTQRFNHRHGLVGHLFQGRYKAILIDRDAYLLALCRYFERNPVAAGLVAAADDWVWSSCRAHLGNATPPAWLDCDGLHGYLAGTRGDVGG